MRSRGGSLGIATLAYVLGWTAHTTFLFYLAPIALRVAGETQRDAWIFAGTAIASVLFVLPAGWLTDRYPRRRVLRGGLGLLAMSYLPLILAPPSFAATLVATIITGAGLVVLFVSFNAYVPDLLGEGSLGSAYGRAGAVATLASSIGPIVAAGVFSLRAEDATRGLVENALLFGVAALLGILLTYLLPRAPRAEPVGTHERFRDTWRATRAVVVPSTFIYLFLGAGYGMTLPYFAVYFLDHLATPKETWGIILGLGTLASATGSLVVGRFAHTYPARWLVLGPQVLLTLSAMAFLFPLTTLALGVAFVTRNLFSSTTAPMVNTIAMPRVHPAARGRVQGWASLAWNIGWAGGAAGGGIMLARLGGGLFPIGAVFGLVGVGVGIYILTSER